MITIACQYMFTFNYSFSVTCWKRMESFCSMVPRSSQMMSYAILLLPVWLISVWGRVFFFPVWKNNSKNSTLSLFTFFKNQKRLNISFSLTGCPVNHLWMIITDTLLSGFFWERCSHQKLPTAMSFSVVWYELHFSSRWIYTNGKTGVIIVDPCTSFCNCPGDPGSAEGSSKLFLRW